MNIHYAGMVRGPEGWARVGRGVCQAFLQMGHSVTIDDRKEVLHRQDFPLSDKLEQCLVTGSVGNDLTLAFVHPGRWKDLSGKLKVVFLQYDTSHLPDAYIEAAKCVDLLLVPSEFCREVAIGSGIPVDKLEVVPYGYDPDVVFPGDGNKEEPFSFLHIAGPHYRKSTAGVVQAFVHAFEAVSDVRLILKTSPRVSVRAQAGHEPPRPYHEALPMTEVAERFAKGDERVRLISEVWSDEQMGDLYRSAHVLVQPSMAESFSLPTLEAMASALPPIVTNWGGFLDTCDQGNAFLLYYSVTPAQDIQYDLEGGAKWNQGLMAQPDYDHLAEAMRLAYDRPDLVQKKAEAARQSVAELTWEHAARSILGVLSEKGLVQI